MAPVLLSILANRVPLKALAAHQREPFPVQCADLLPDLGYLGSFPADFTRNATNCHPNFNNSPLLNLDISVDPVHALHYFGVSFGPTLQFSEELCLVDYRREREELSPPL
jgi:hypothetical protein